MWVDFKIAHFMVTLLFMIFEITIYGENPNKIPIGHELNQVVK